MGRVMTLLAAGALFFLCTFAVVNAGETKVIIERPEGNRTFYVYVPTSYSSSRAAPLMIAWHGLNDNCLNFGHAIGMQNYSDANGFLYVYPCGWIGLIGVGWNAGTCCVGNVDDVGFARAIVTYMQSNFNVDSKHVWTIGFSNGAFMSERLACEASDVFSAAVSTSGVVCLKPGNGKGLAACNSSFIAAGRTISFLGIHGNADPLVPWNGDALLGFPPILENFYNWVSLHGCKTGPTQTLNKGPYTNQQFSDCNNNVKLELVKNDGGGHEWPEDSNFDTTDYAAKFLLSLLD